jgi:hypothetical protein
MSNRICAWALFSTLLVLSVGMILAQGETVGAQSKIEITNASFIAQSPERENLNGEWVEIANQGDANASLAGWTLQDQQNHTFAFPDFTLRVGAKARIHTGEGSNTGADLYWNRSSAVWNNDGDVATLKDASGGIVSSYPHGA